MKYFLSLLIVCFVTFAFGQSDLQTTSNAVLLRGGIQMEAVPSTWNVLKNDPQVVYEGYAFVVVRFHAMPNTVQKEALALQGIELLHYVPNAAWVAKIDAQLAANALETAGMIQMGKVGNATKLAPGMANAEIPAYAGTAAAIRAKVIFWQGKDQQALAKLCSDAGLLPSELDAKWPVVSVTGSLQNLLAFAAHPLVQHIEWPEPPIENENLNELTLVQSNYISDNPARGLFFNGAGVTIAVNEGGTVDSSDSPNYKGRIDRGLESGGVSGHKTSVATRMASAGNIDPVTRGTAFGATLQSGGINFGNAATSGVSIVNNSFGYGCIGGTTTYNSGAATNDNLVRTNPTFMITYSAGNEGGTDCGYGAGAGWGNITGLVKSAKNIFAVGALNTAGALTGFSSRGPAWDGRILPDVCATGPGGTSHASPNLAGVYGQLLQAFRQHNAGATPPSGLLKAIILNTADEMENPGPDFKTGFGKVNARRAYEVIRQGQHLTATVAHGASNAHNLVVPANVKELKVMVYWTDYEATPGIVTKALVNDLDAVLVDPGTTQWRPWVLDPTPIVANLNANAVRAIDTLNNVEQITLANPAAGTYTLNVGGTMVPQGPQTYFVVYEFVVDEVVVSYPAGGEHFLPSTTERLRWESLGGTGTFSLDYSLNGGTNWTNIATGLSANDRYYDWSVPAAVTKSALIRVQRGAVAGISDTTFHILVRPTNLALAWSCADSSLFMWDSVPNVDGYIVYRLGTNYMDSVAYVTSPSHIVHNFSATETEYVSVAAVQNGAISRRMVAIERPASNFNCTMNDVGMIALRSPNTRYLPSCISPNLRVEIKNYGVNAVSTVPVAYRIDGGPVNLSSISTNLSSAMTQAQTIATSLVLANGGHLLEAWTQMPSDPISNNDTIRDSIFVYSGNSAALQLSENFDAFTLCSTAWGCEQITCNLAQGWYNIPNMMGGDDIDWRTNTGATGTGGTGPSADHTTGSGNYLYLEGSGNNGAGCLNSEALLYSPCIDLNGITQPTLSYWYHAYGSGIGALHVDVVVDGELIEDIVPPVIGQQGNQWLQGIADLSPFVGHNIVVVFRGATGNGWACDLAIDDIEITAFPTAVFAASDTVVCLNQTVQLSNNSILANSYAWSISPATFSYQNGTNSTSAQPAVAFANAGNYTVQLNATNTFGTNTAVQTNYITVVAGPVALFVADVDTAYCASDSVILSTNATAGQIQWYQNGIVQAAGNSTTFGAANPTDGDAFFAANVVNASCVLYSDTVVVRVLPSTMGSISPTACSSYTSPSGQVWTQSNTYIDTIVNAAGCDSILTIQLTIDNIDLSLNVNGGILSANQNGATYQWLDCNNNFAAVLGATNQTFVPSQIGTYACLITNGTCQDTSACTTITVVGIAETLGSSLQVYPNPATSQVSVKCAQVVRGLKVIDLLGALVLEGEGETILVEKLAAGVYLLEVETEVGKVYRRFVKE